MLTKSIPAVKVPATMPLQQPRRFPASSRGGRIDPGAAATDYPAAAMPSLWRIAFNNLPAASFVRFVLGLLSPIISSLFKLSYSFICLGRDVFRESGGSCSFPCRFNRLRLNATAVSLQRYQQKIYRVAILGPCRIAAPEDVPA